VERVEGIEGRSDRKVGQRERGVAILLEGLGLPPRPVLVLGVVLHVPGTDPLGLVDERPLVHLRQHLPLGAKPLRDFGVVHLRVFLRHLSTLNSRPNHEGVHRPLDVVTTLTWTHYDY